MATNYEIDYNDKRFTDVEADKNAALNDVDKTYNSIISNSDKYYQDQIDAAKNYADTQTKLQQEQTDFAIEKIEQQKDQAHTDYIKEQSGAYVDWQKQSNQYGVEAEKQAAAGLSGTGYSESSKVSMYNAYQNRVATARESYTRAVLNYDNSINDARLKNNAILAEIAYNALQQELELSLQGFQYKNNLLLEQASIKRDIDNTYWGRYQDVLNQINTENALEEQVRQYNQTYELQVKEYEESVRQFNQNYEFKVKEFNEQIRQFNEEIDRLKKKDAQEYKLQIQELELKKQQAEEAKRQFEEEQKLEKAKLEESKRQFDKEYALSQAKSTGGGGDSGGGGGGGGDSGGGGVVYDPKKGDDDNKPTTKDQNMKRQIDMQSVLSLGLGPISESKLDSLVSAGYVKEVVSGGTVKFQWTAAGLKQKNLYNKLG